MPAYDGSIVIDTKIDSAGINAATKNINDAFAKMSTGLKGILSAVTAMVAGYVSIAAAMALISKYNLWASSFGSQIFALNWAFETLQGSILNLLMTAFVPMIPMIIMVINWLTKLIQYFTLIVGALFGLKTTIGDIVKSGALAAFDKLNVLGDKFGPAATPAPMTIPQDLLDKVAAFKKGVEGILAPFLALWNEFMVPFLNWIGQVALPWLLEQLQKLADWAAKNPQAFLTIIGILALLALVLLAIASPVVLVLLIIGLLILALILLVKYWPEISKSATDCWNWIVKIWGIVADWFNTNVIEPIKKFFFPMWEWLSAVANDAWLIIKLVWNTVSDWFKANVVDPVIGIVGKMWDAFAPGRDIVYKVFGGIAEVIKVAINGIIWLINQLIAGWIGAVNIVTGGWNLIGKAVPGWMPIPEFAAPQIPYLATGAVIPPNSAFLAIMGDQKSGRNIEAPENLIRSIVAEEVARNQQTVNINFTGNLASLARILKPAIEREQLRIGGTIVQRTGASLQS